MSAYRVSLLRLRRQAQQLLTPQAAGRIDLAPLLAQLGVEVQVLDLEPDLSAILYIEPPRRAVVVNAHLEEASQRFAIARQLGHLVLHPPREVRIDLGAAIPLSGARRSDLADFEPLEATWFALELLLPYAWLTADFDGRRLDLQDRGAIDRWAAELGVDAAVLIFRIAMLIA